MSKILIIEDDDTMRLGIEHILKSAGHDTVSAKDGVAGVAACRSFLPDLVITDYKMAPLDGLAVLERVKAFDPEIDVVLITAYGTIETAVEAMKKGAADFVAKGFLPEELRLKVARVLERQHVKRENLYLKQELEQRYNFGELIGSSPKMQAVFAQIQKVALADSSVLVTGESGTGKELVARAIHRHSPRHAHAFVKVNCCALPEGVLESELFGHEKGAFTGAVKQHRGKFELADGGTIFLDEIGEMPLLLQSKLLRVIQEREFDRVGGEKPIKVNVRIIAATNRNLEDMVRDKRFREDLYYRLNVIPIELPPLRERAEDIPALVASFLEKKSKELGRKPPQMTPEAMEALTAYDFPGNVRELENLIERALVLADGDTLTARAFSALVPPPSDENIIQLPQADILLDNALEAVERQLIERAMEKARGVKMQAAKILGIKPSVLYYKLEKHGLIKGDDG